MSRRRLRGKWDICCRAALSLISRSDSTIPNMAARLCWELKVYVLLPTVHRTRTLSKMQFEWRRNLPNFESTTRLRRNWHKYPQGYPNAKRLAVKKPDES